ncbi:MAG TPA: hypothetical protein VD769_08935 [Gaiellaceae bacterium]|nr:hypothetical protein [Gaiellaceae bacterium]
MTDRGSCYGFGVRSDLPLAYLREGGGAPLEVVAPAPPGPRPGDRLLLEWRATPAQPLDAALWSDGDGFRLRIGDAGWFSVSPGEGRVEVPAGDGLRTEERLWGIPALLCFRARGDLPLHAAAVEAGGSAVLVAAPRTYGKTTAAAAFHRAGCRVLAEDTACVRLGPPAEVVPGPAMLRLRPDVAARLELPRARRLGEDSDRVHYALEDPGDCAPVPLRAVVFLDEADGAPSLEPVERPDALRDLWALSFKLPTEEDVSRSFAGVADLAASVPAFRLRRRLAFEELDDHVELVLGAV